VRIASAIVFVVCAALFAVWWGWVRAPPPARVCEHVVEVTLQDTAGGQLAPETRARLLEATQQQCEKRAFDKLQLRGRLKYAQWAKCLMAADDVAALGGC
jgi:hypothetical protein